MADEKREEKRPVLGAMKIEPTDCPALPHWVAGAEHEEMAEKIGGRWAGPPPAKQKKESPHG